MLTSAIIFGFFWTKKKLHNDGWNCVKHEETTEKAAQWGQVLNLLLWQSMLLFQSVHKSMSRCAMWQINVLWSSNYSLVFYMSVCDYLSLYLSCCRTCWPSSALSTVGGYQLQPLVGSWKRGVKWHFIMKHWFSIVFFVFFH